MSSNIMGKQHKTKILYEHETTSFDTLYEFYSFEPTLQFCYSPNCIVAYLAKMRHMARRVVTSSGTAWPRVQRLEVGDGGVTSGIRTSGSWVDPN